MRVARIRTGILLLAALAAAAPQARTAASAGPFDEAPYLGLAVFGAGGVPMDFCAGVLLSPTVFLTAGHCTDGTDLALVWFEPEVTFDPASAQTGVPLTHPAYRGAGGLWNDVDVGIVLLDPPADVAGYAVLPAVGALDGPIADPARMEPVFTAMGYGLQTVVSFMQHESVRYRGIGVSVGLFSAVVEDFEIHVARGVRREAGRAVCPSDSGGALMLGTTNVVAGVGGFASSGDCSGIGTYSRLDTQRASEFVLSFLR